MATKTNKRRAAGGRRLAHFFGMLLSGIGTIFLVLSLVVGVQCAFDRAVLAQHGVGLTWRAASGAVLIGVGFAALAASAGEIDESQFGPVEGEVRQVEAEALEAELTESVGEVCCVECHTLNDAQSPFCRRCGSDFRPTAAA